MRNAQAQAGQAVTKSEPTPPHTPTLIQTHTKSPHGKHAEAEQKEDSEVERRRKEEAADGPFIWTLC